MGEQRPIFSVPAAGLDARFAGAVASVTHAAGYGAAAFSGRRTWVGPQSDRHMARLVDDLGSMVLEPCNTSERFCAVFLDERRSVLGHKKLGYGCNDALSVRLRDLFAGALSCNARSFIMAHNHPSENCRPSERDIAATERVSSIARALDLELLDHLIFTQSQAYSLRAREVL